MEIFKLRINVTLEFSPGQKTNRAQTFLVIGLQLVRRHHLTQYTGEIGHALSAGTFWCSKATIQTGIDIVSFFNSGWHVRRGWMPGGTQPQYTAQGITAALDPTR